MGVTDRVALVLTVVVGGWAVSCVSRVCVCGSTLAGASALEHEMYLNEGRIKEIHNNFCLRK